MLARATIDGARVCDPQRSPRTKRDGRELTRRDMSHRLKRLSRADIPRQSQTLPGIVPSRLDAASQMFFPVLAIEQHDLLAWKHTQETSIRCDLHGPIRKRWELGSLWWTTGPSVHQFRPAKFSPGTLSKLNQIEPTIFYFLCKNPRPAFRTPNSAPPLATGDDNDIEIASGWVKGGKWAGAAIQNAQPHFGNGQ